MNISIFTSTIGNIGLFLSFLLICYSIIASIGGLKLNNQRLLISSKRSNIIVFYVIAIVFVALLISFLNNDFSKIFVYKNSSSDLPLFYKLTGPWGGLEGSLLLWSIILAGYSMIVAVKYLNKFLKLTTVALIYLNIIQLFILSILISWSNPLALNLPLSTEGQGLNPLLQHPGMIAHPPLLYLGFIGLSVPFAFALSSLTLSKFNNDWIYLTRRWTIIAWMFLSAGIIIGGLWAYEVLGWGGFWAWDPVENSSLLPWLAATAFLHSAMAQEKTGKLRNWNFFIIIIAFLLTIIGTFITRSGILNSVHAFSKSNLGLYFLIFIAITAFYSFGLMIIRLKNKESVLNDSFKHKFSREVLLLINNIFFFVLIIAILYGTIFPLFAEVLTGRKISIQSPFFNQISLPVVLALLILMSIAPFTTWSSFYSYTPNVIRKLKLALFLSIFVGFFTKYFILDNWQFVLLVCFVFISLFLTLMYFYKILLKPVFLTPRKKLFFFKINRRRFGGILVHFAVIIGFFSVLGKYFSYDLSTTLKLDQTIQFSGYELHYIGIDSWIKDNVSYQGAKINVIKEGEIVTQLIPSKAYYSSADQIISIIDMYRKSFFDLYLSIVEINNDKSITLTIYSNKFVLALPISLALIIIGGLLTLSGSRNVLKKTKKELVDNL